jgi:chromosome segregation ATPase
MKRMEPRRGEGPYTMGRLERAVEQLVDGQDTLLARIDALEKVLVEREQRIAELEAEVEAGDRKRANALARIDQIIDQLDELEGRAESASLSAAE